MMSTTTTTTTTTASEAVLRKLQDWLQSNANNLKNAAKLLSNSLLPVGDPGNLYGQLLALAFKLYEQNKEQVPTAKEILQQLGIDGDAPCAKEFKCTQVHINQSVTEVVNYLQQRLPMSKRACSFQLSGAMNLALVILSGQKQQSGEDEAKESDSENRPSETVFTYAHQPASLFRPVAKPGHLIISEDFWKMLSHNLQFFMDFETKDEQGKIMLLREKGEPKEGFWYLFFMSRLLELFRGRELTSLEVQTRMSKVCHFFTLPVSSIVTTYLKPYLVDPKCANTAQKWHKMVKDFGEAFKSANRTTVQPSKLSTGLLNKEKTFGTLTDWYTRTNGTKMSQKEWNDFEKKQEQLRKLALNGQLPGDDTEPERTSGSVTNNATSPLQTNSNDSMTESNESSNGSVKFHRGHSKRCRRRSQRSHRSRSPLARPSHRDVAQRRFSEDANDSEHSDSSTEHSDAYIQHSDAYFQHLDTSSEHSDASSEHSDASSEHQDASSQSDHSAA